MQLAIGLVLGTVTSAIAASKGRNAVGWFFLGFFFGCISLNAETLVWVETMTGWEPAALGDVIEIVLKEVDSSRGALRFRLNRGAGWDRALAATPQESLADWGEFATRLAIRQGRLRAELLDKRGNSLGSGELPLRALLEMPDTEVLLLPKPPGRLAKSWCDREVATIVDRGPPPAVVCSSGFSRRVRLSSLESAPRPPHESVDSGTWLGIRKMTRFDCFLTRRVLPDQRLARQNPPFRNIRSSPSEWKTGVATVLQ